MQQGFEVPPQAGGYKVFVSVQKSPTKSYYKIW